MKFSSELQKNLNTINTLNNSDDINVFNFTSAGKDCALAFIESIVRKDALGELIVRPLICFNGKPDFQSMTGAVYFPEKAVCEQPEEAAEKLTRGETLLFIDGFAKCVSFNVIEFEKRSVTEPPTSHVIKGPREGFVESLSTNIGLMRKRLRTPDFRIEKLMIGKYSGTSVAVCYIDGVVQKNLVKPLINRLKKINIDAVLDSSYIAKYISEHKTSIFKQAGTTEKPDVLTSKILEGRVAILVDGSPIAISVPYLLVEDFQGPGDYYTSAHSATVSRILRVISVFLAVYLPSIFISAQLFHLQLIPLSFLLTIVNSIKGIPLSPSFEMFFTLLIFELLNEASVRAPKSVGMVVSIVGGLVLGETAVNAGIISAPTLMIIALSGICLYTVPALEKTFSIIRLLFLIVAGSLGGYGIILFSSVFLVYLLTFENYSTPLLAPFAPLVVHDLQDGFYKGFLLEIQERPLTLRSPNRTRLRVKTHKSSSK